MNNATWYERRDVQDTLIVFGRAIQGAYPFEVVIEPDRAKCRSGACSFDIRRITVNPNLFDAPASEQYLITKALLVHEAGHRRYTTPAPLPAPIRQIANILEDERIECRMWEEFIGLRWLIRKLAARFYQEAGAISPESEQPAEVVSYFLQLRWARRAGRSIKGELSAPNRLLWGKVEPLVTEAWSAISSETVNRNAIVIAEILGLSGDSPVSIPTDTYFRKEDSCG